MNSATWRTQSDQADHNVSTSVALNTALMWRILDYAAPRRDSSVGDGIFQLSSSDNSQSRRQPDQTIMTEPAGTNAMRTLENSTSRIHGSTPDWFDPVPSTAIPPLVTWEAAERRPPSAVRQSDSTLQVSNPNMDVPEMANWYWTEDPSHETLMNVSNDPMVQFYDRNNANPAWWDFGNL